MLSIILKEIDIYINVFIVIIREYPYYMLYEKIWSTKWKIYLG